MTDQIYVWYAHDKSPQPLAPFHPMLVYTMDLTEYEWYYTNVDFSPALAEYSNSSQQFGDDVHKKFVMFLTLQYSTNGEQITLLNPNQVPGAVIRFGGLLANADGLPIQGTATIVPTELPQCMSQQYNAFKAQLNGILDQLDSATGGEVVALKFAADVAFFSTAWTNCSAQLDNILDAKFIQTTIDTTDCVDVNSNDSCCNTATAWRSVCRPREVSALAESYTVDSSNLGSCGSLTCTESFLEDYVDTTLQPCQELSTAIATYTRDKGKILLCI
jgi:hypothetical protein